MVGRRAGSVSGATYSPAMQGANITWTEANLRRYIQDQYGTVFTRFVALVRKATPELPDSERFWRLHFALGTVIFTLSGLDALRDIAEKDYDEHVSVRDLVRRMMPVVVSALKAPLPEPAPTIPPATREPTA